MAIMRLKEIVDMSADDREQKLVDLRIELARMRTMVNAGGAVDNPTRIYELRKTIAQIITIQNEYKLGIRQAEPEPEKKAKKAEKTKPAKTEEKEETEAQPKQ